WTVAALLSPMLVTLAPGSQLVDSVAVPAKMQLTHEHGHPGPASACYRSPAAPVEHSRGQADTRRGIADSESEQRREIDATVRALTGAAPARGFPWSPASGPSSRHPATAASGWRRRSTKACR